MVAREGGVCAPAPVKIPVNQYDVRYLTRIGEERDARRTEYRSSRSKWKQGSCSNPVLIGLMGEYGTQVFLSRRIGTPVKIVDDTLNNGDGGTDLKLFGLTYQIKTSQGVYDSVLVRRIDDRGRMVSMCDRYVFCVWKPGDVVCLLLGWCDGDTLRDNGTIQRPKSAGGKWWNLELATRHLQSMDCLARFIKAERG